MSAAPGTPELSAVVTTIGRPAQLRRLIASLARQSDPTQLELIVVDQSDDQSCVSVVESMELPSSPGRLPPNEVRRLDEMWGPARDWFDPPFQRLRRVQSRQPSRTLSIEWRARATLMHCRAFSARRWEALSAAMAGPCSTGHT